MQPSCAPSHKTTAYQISGELVDPNSREKQFTVLRYHVTCNNKYAHRSQEHKVTCGKAPGGADFPSTSPDPLLLVSPSNPGLVNFINQCKCELCMT